jgi:phytoene dehydrogenase-like protein
MPARMTDVDVVVIGAGCGGLSAAALLASRGRRVLVLDQNDAVGGCASSFEREGYTFDVAASIFEVLEPLKRTLATLGTSVEQEIDLLSCDPTCAVALRDGKRITFPMGGILDASCELSVEDARNWSRYASYCEELYEALLDTLYVQPVSTLSELVGVLRKAASASEVLAHLFDELPGGSCQILQRSDAAGAGLSGPHPRTAAGPAARDLQLPSLRRAPQPRTIHAAE